MSNYIFFIGGSGARVYKALIHGAAAGMLNTKEISVLLIDADKSNAATTESIKLYQQYNNIYSHFAVRERKIFNCKILMETEKVLSPVKPGVKNLQVAIGANNSNRQRLLQCLYTNAEIQQDLEGGFYSHPNIGCIFFNDFDYEEFTNCLEEIEKKLEKDEEVRITLVGSVFGGTGAAGIPTIYKKIKRGLENALHKENLYIGGIFLEPYFKVVGECKEKKQISINMQEFYFNTYEALSYYKENYNMDFSQIYLLGQQEQDVVNMQYAPMGNEQDNKPHILELYAALAIDSFLSGEMKKAVYGMVCEKQLDWGTLPRNVGSEKNTAYLLAGFARAQAVYLSEVCNYAKEESGNIRKMCRYAGIMVPQWYKAYGINKQVEEIQSLKNYGVAFMEWLYLINSTYDMGGSLYFDPKIKLFGEVLQNIYIVSKNINVEEKHGIEEKNENRKKFLDKFDELVDKTANIEYVLKKVMKVLSLAGIGVGSQSLSGAIGLFYKLFTLVCEE